tara:strand:- start:273 stop:698 length:426 start_codon:yes stop_codon:yes gene_type:complete
MGLFHKSLITLLFIFAFALTGIATAEEARVIRVIDGDSLRIELRGLEMDLRLLGVDAPEWNQPGGEEAKAFVQAWVDKGDSIDLEFDRKMYGKYGRLLAWVWMDDELLQEELVRHGHAQVKWLSVKNKHYSRLKHEKGEIK